MGERETDASELATDDGLTVVDWRPSFATSVVWQILGLALVFVGVFLFGTAYLLVAGAESLEFVSINLMLLIGSALAVLIVHEGFHGLAALWFGGRPQFGAALLHKVFPVFYCTVPGHRFSRAQFAVFALAPAIGISVIGILMMTAISWGPVLVLALAVNLGGAVGDFWMTGLVLQQPRGTLIEDQRDGIRLHHVASAS